MSGESPLRPPGCLTEAELLELQTAPAGQVPGALAQHLASCERCQQRALFGSEARRTRRRRAPERPTPARLALLLLGLLMVTAAFLYSVYLLTGRLG